MLTPYVVPFERGFGDPRYRRIVMVTAAQSGKALALDTPLATPTGWTTMGEVRVGDTLFDEHGTPTAVLAVEPVQYGKDCYEVEFCDGSKIVADADHYWTVETSRWKRDGGARRETLTTAEMVERGVRLANGAARFSIPVARPLDLPDVDLPVTPYFMGVWLGDGNSRASRITAGHEDVDEVCSLIRAEGYSAEARRYETAWDIAVKALRDGEPVSLKAADNLAALLRNLGVLNNKHIPDAYLRASIAQREALLQGLMDTDGGVENGRSVFCSKYERIARQVADLVTSLGFRPVVKEKIGRNGYRSWLVCFYAYRERAPFRLKRKVAALPSVHHVKSRPYLNDSRYIRAIRPAPSVPVRCIGVDSPSHLYLAGERMIPTHNTDSMLDLIGERLDTKPVPILYVGPSREFLTDQFEPRLMALFDEAPKLRAKVQRGKRMKKTLKRVAGVTLRLAHAGSSTALKSDPAGLALVDEYDEMLANIRGQGDPLGLVEARGITFADFVTGITSTPSQGMVEVEADPQAGLEFWKQVPSDDVASPIWRLWQEGTRHHWTWRCPHCEEWFVPRFSLLRWPKTATPAQARREAHLECPSNGCVIEESDKAAMNAGGVYVAPGQWFDEDGNVVGDPPDTSTLSFWVSGLASPFVSFGERAEAYLTALASGETDKVQTAVNAGFGEVYTPGGGDVPEWQEVAALKAPYPARTLPDEVVFLTAGIDVQKNRLPFVIRGWGPRATSWLIDAGELWGETALPDVWEDLADLLTQDFDGLPIKLAFVDSGFRPGKKFAVPEHRVYSFARRFQRFVFPTKGYARQARPIIRSQFEVKPDGKTAKYGGVLFRLDTDHWKSWVHERLRYPQADERGKPVLGAWFLHAETPDEYCQQIVSEARVTSPTGQPQWVQRSRENHFLDCEALAAAAGFQLNAHRLGPNARRRGGGGEAKKVYPVPDINGAPGQVQPAAQSKSDRFAEFAARFNR